jgi:hypothetical protein
VLTADGADLSERLDRADLVVDEHHAREARVWANRSLKLVEVYEALFINLQACVLSCF